MTVFQALESASQYAPARQEIPIVFVILPIIAVAVLLRVYLKHKVKKQQEQNARK